MEKNPHVVINREKEPEKMKELVDDKLPHIPGVKRYSDALIRKNPTLNTAWLCESLYQSLLKKENVDFKLDTYVMGYNMEGKKVKSVMVNFEKEHLPADVVVMCIGPQARTHIKEHFDTIFPMISAQGYSMDLPDYDPSIDQDFHVKIGDRGYAYA